MNGKRLPIGVGALFVVALGVLWRLAQARPEWPWFSIGLLLLIASISLGAVPGLRARLGAGWPWLTFFNLVAAGFFVFFLFQVETYRQRSERLEVRGVYFDPAPASLRIGVGHDSLDVRLEGSPETLDRWFVELQRGPGSGYRIGSTGDVDMIELSEKGWLRRRSSSRRPVHGWALSGSRPVTLTLRGREAEGAVTLALVRGGKRGTLMWDAQRAHLSMEDDILDRRLARGLANGIEVGRLPWDSVPDPALARDLVITRARPGHAPGGVVLRLPSFRVVSRSGRWVAQSPTVSQNAETVPDRTVAPGDSVWVTSRGKTWAFSLGALTERGLASPPVAVGFVRRPRPNGWALPARQDCGGAGVCAVLSSRPLPPPLAHFNLEAFGLDTTRYAYLARLSVEADRVSLVGACDSTAFPVGARQPSRAFPLDGASAGCASAGATLSSGDRAEAGLLLRVRRAAAGDRTDVARTLAALLAILGGAFLVLTGNHRLKQAARMAGANPLWWLFNLIVVFLAVRLALGLRVAYASPYYERAAESSVGMWVAFSALVVALGRWTWWAPRCLAVLLAAWRRLPGKGGSRPWFEPQEGPDPWSSGWPRPPMRPASAPQGRAPGDWAWPGAILMATGSVFVLFQYSGAFVMGLAVAAMCAGLWVLPALADASSVSLGPVRLLASPVRLGRGGRTRAQAGTRVPAAEAKGRASRNELAITAGFAVIVTFLVYAPGVALGMSFLLFVVSLLARLRSRRPEDRESRVGGEDAAVQQPLRGRSVRGPRRSRLIRFLAEAGAEKWGAGAALLALLLTLFDLPLIFRFWLVFFLFLLTVRAGALGHRVIREARGWEKTATSVASLLVVPLGVLVGFTIFDFGLGLVFFVPVLVTVVLGMDLKRVWDNFSQPPGRFPGLVFVLVLLAVVYGTRSVLRPPVGPLETAATVPAYAEAFVGTGNRAVDLARKIPLLDGPITRATVRSLAASHPQLLEKALAYAGRSEALEAAQPSIEQIWGGRAYAAAGWFGTGFAGTTLLGRGVPTAVSYAENTFSVYILSEHGALGGLLVLLLYSALLGGTALWVLGLQRDEVATPDNRVILAAVVGGALWITVPALYVAASNLGLVPLTGQNMPFLGLNSWADAVLGVGVSTAMLAALAHFAVKGRGGVPSDARNARHA